jgi:hypothetical protein
MSAPAPIFRSQGNELFRTDKQNSSYRRGQAVPYGANGAAPITAAELEISIVDLPSAAISEPLLRFRMNIGRTFSGGTGDASVAATGAPSFSIKKNGTAVGSVSFSGTTGTVSFSDSSFPAGSLFELYPPTVADATLDQVSITLATS